MRGGILAGAALALPARDQGAPGYADPRSDRLRTLATEIWNQTSFGFYEASAIPSLILLAVAAPPLYLLSERGTVSA